MSAPSGHPPRWLCWVSRSLYQNLANCSTWAKTSLFSLTLCLFWVIHPSPQAQVPLPKNRHRHTLFGSVANQADPVFSRFWSESSAVPNRSVWKLEVFYLCLSQWVTRKSAQPLMIHFLLGQNWDKYPRAGVGTGSWWQQTEETQCSPGELTPMNSSRASQERGDSSLQAERRSCFSDSSKFNNMPWHSSPLWSVPWCL